MWIRAEDWLPKGQQNSIKPTDITQQKNKATNAGLHFFNSLTETKYVNRHIGLCSNN